MSDRSIWHVSQDTRHYRLYKYWLDHHPTDLHDPNLGYRENLCHYVRVLLFWGPLCWFVTRTYFTSKDTNALNPIRPCTIVVGLIALAFLVWAVIFHPLSLLIGILAGAGILALSSIALWFLWKLDDDPVFAKACGRPFRFIRRMLTPVGKFLHVWFFEKYVSKYHGLSVGGLVLILLLLAGWIIWGLYWWPIFLILPGGIAAVFAIVFLAYLIADYVWPWLKERLHIKPKEQTGFVKVASEYIAAKKHRICPFIELPEEVNNEGPQLLRH